MALLSFAIVLVGAALLTFVTDFPINVAGELLIGLGMGLGQCRGVQDGAEIRPARGRAAPPAWSAGSARSAAS